MNERFTVPFELNATEAWVDEHGFAAPAAIPEKRAILELLSERVVIVTGEPWIGKTYVSKQLTTQLQGRRFADRVSLEEGDSPVVPRWWADWRSSQEEAWWIVDALDEALHTGTASVSDVLRPLRDLGPEQQQRLHLVIFTRDDDSLGTVRDLLQHGHLPATVQRLLPFDEPEASRIVGDPQKFSQALRHLDDPSLRELAKYEPVLRVLANSTAQRHKRNVLQDALEALCTEHSGRRRERTEAWNRNDMFHAACRIAAIMLLCDLPTVQLDFGRGHLPLRDAFPSHPALRAAAEQLRHTALFQKTPVGHRFRQRFVMELLASFGVRHVDPEAFRLVTRGNAHATPSRLGTFEKVLRDVHPDVLQDPLADLTEAATRRTARWASAKIDALLAAIGTAHWPMPHGDEEPLRMFRVPGIERVLDSRLANTSIPESGREYLFRIAFACELSGLAGRAVRIAMDDEEPSELRVMATYFATRFGGRESLLTLRNLLACPSSAEQPPRVRARVLEILVQDGLIDPLEAAALAPAPDEHLYDAREAAVSAIEKHLTLDHARAVIDHWNGATQLPQSIQDPVLHRLRPPSIELLLAAPVTPGDIRRVATLLRHDTTHTEVPDRDLMRRLSDDAAFRERLYTELIDSDKSWRVSMHIVGRDASWLRRIARANPTERILNDLYRAMRGLADEDPLARDVRTFFEKEHPAELATRDVRWREGEAQRRTLEERQAERRRKTDAIEIVDAVQRILAAESSTPSKSLREFGWVCFVEKPFRPNDISGSFADLPFGTQAMVVDRVRTLLGIADPEPLPASDATTYSGYLLYEASAFRAALTFDGERHWLSPAVIAARLPAALFTLHGDVPVIVSELLRSSPETTRRCVLDELRRDLVRRQHTELARRLPVETWSDEFSDQVGELVLQTREAAPSSSRGSLLRALATRSPSVGERVATELLLDSTAGHELRVVAADVLLAVAPANLTWARTEALVQRTEDVEAMGGLLHQLGSEPYVDAKKLPSDLLAGLAERLARLYPRKLDPDVRGARWVGRDDDARGTRDRVLAVLVERASTSSDAEAAVARISAFDSWFLQWVARAKATAALESVIRSITPVPAVPTVEDVVRVLDEHSYRPIRTETDLWRLVAEILRNAVQPSIGNDVDLLYDLSSARATRGRSRGGRSNESAPPRANEGKLQAYISRRLDDLFPRYWGSVELRPLNMREPQGQFRRRCDILVVAALGGPTPATVAVEIKWSHDRRCGTSLTEQLVNKYLLQEGRSHGVYLVGWSGTPKRDTWARRKREHVQQSRRARATHPDLNVIAAHLECPWQDGEGERAARHRRNCRRSDPIRTGQRRRRVRRA